MTRGRPGNPLLCVALDVPTLAEAERLAQDLAPLVPVLKVGLELFSAEGPRAVEAVRRTGADVFLDLKVADIPRTAAAAVRRTAALGVGYLTIHGIAGREMVRACVEASGESSGPQLLVVGALTSLNEAALADAGVEGGVEAQVMRMAKMASEERAHGVVLSARELNLVRPQFPELVLCTPGIRPPGSSQDDHLRSWTPMEAAAAGADLVVVGRPVLNARDPVSVVEELSRDVDAAAVNGAGRK